MIKLGDKVKIADVEKVKNDKLLEDEALKIIQKNDYIGEVTKISAGIHFVGFSNDLGWVTQGYKENEIKAVE